MRAIFIMCGLRRSKACILPRDAHSAGQNLVARGCHSQPARRSGYRPSHSRRRDRLVCEESFADIPRLSPAIRHVIPVAVRRWRKSLLAGTTWREICALRRGLERCATTYPRHAGPAESALIARQAHGPHLAMPPILRGNRSRHVSMTGITPSTSPCMPSFANRLLAGAALAYPLPGFEYGILPALASWFPKPYCRPAHRHQPRRQAVAGERLDYVARELVRRGITPRAAGRQHRTGTRCPHRGGSATGRRGAGLGIRELAGIVGRSWIAIGVDTGLAHLQPR